MQNNEMSLGSSEESFIKDIQRNLLFFFAKIMPKLPYAYFYSFKGIHSFFYEV